MNKVKLSPKKPCAGPWLPTGGGELCVVAGPRGGFAERREQVARDQHLHHGGHVQEDAGAQARAPEVR